MQCRIDRPVDRDDVFIYLFNDHGRGRTVYLFSHDHGHMEPLEVAEGEQMPPSLVMRPQMLEAIVKAGSDFLPPSAATDNHLNDAVGVRDRLLGMVERIVDADLAREATRG